MADERIVPVIMSGGAGTRLWPLSRAARPKQLLALAGDKTMLQMTAERFAGWASAEAPIVVANARHADEIEAQLAEVGAAPSAIILEPIGRNTAPAVALAALIAEPEQLLLVMPSDHFIAAPERLREAVKAATSLAGEGWLVTFGIAPTGPETGYGYIRRGGPIAPGVFAAAQFTEKPDLATAEAFLSTGEFSWNAGIFLFRASAMIEALRTHAPEVLDATSAAMAGRARAGLIALDPDAFARSPSISIDYAVMERAERVAVVPLDMEWSDIGSWDALYDLLPKDSGANAASGDILLEETEGCLVSSGGPVVATLGLKDLIIVATPEAVLVLPRGRSQEIRKLVEELQARRHPGVS
jgi:mannose-1-phosphate guanylyltransferase